MAGFEGKIRDLDSSFSAHFTKTKPLLNDLIKNELSNDQILALSESKWQGNVYHVKIRTWR